MSAPTRERGLARERAQHLGQLERPVERARGAHQRAVLRGARRPAVLGLEAGEAGGGHLRERLGVGDLVRA